MNKSRRSVVYSLLILTTGALCLGVTSGATIVQAEGLFDYSNGTNVASIKAGDLLSKIDSSIDSSEVDYLNHQDQYSLEYSESFLDNNVRTSRVGDYLYVFTYESSYKDANGRTWTWVPVSVTADSTHSLECFNDLYLTEINDPLRQIEDVTINYQLTLDVEPNVWNSIINVAYDAAVDFAAQDDTYQEELAYYDRRPKSEEQYQEQLAQYNDYLEDYQAYLNDQENYELYLSKYAKYLEDYAKYEQYLKDKAQYQKDLIDYAQNQEDWEYYIANHEQNLKEYNEFGIKYENSRYQIEAMNIAYTYDDERSASLASYVLGDTVTEVLSKKDELTTLGVPSSLIDACNTATVRLRTCFREYRNLTTDEERYSYYYVNYNYIRSYSMVLLRNLERFFRYKTVYDVLKDRDKIRQYKTLLFQLIYFANAVNDQTVYNHEAWDPVYNKGDMSKPGAAILDENFYIEGATYLTWLKGYDFIDTTKTATPSSGIWPTKQVDLLPEPPKMSEPVEPTVVNKPIAPNPVPQPTIPSEVLEPIPYDPSAVEPEVPEALKNQININLLTAYRSNKIHERDQISESKEITLLGNHNIDVAEHEVNVAIFHDQYNTPIDYVFFDVGVQYTGDAPNKDADEHFEKYFFDYWSDEQGDGARHLDLTMLNSSAKLYPIFYPDDDTRQKYTITWNYLDGSVTTEVFADNIPTPPKNPIKPETEDHYYIFNGWSPMLSPALSDTSYTPIFLEKDIYTTTFNIDGNLYEVRTKENFKPTAPTTYNLEDGTSYVITGWDRTIEEAHSNEIYVATVVKYYTITWNVLGEITTEKYLAGTPISYKPAEPDVRWETNAYYAFEWDKSFGIADGNKTFVGKYVSHFYPTINLKIEADLIDLTGQYLSESDVEFPTTYHNEHYHYDITGWTKQSHLYIASFNRTRYFAEGINFGVTDDVMNVDAETKHLNSIDVGYYLNSIRIGENNVYNTKIKFESGILYLSTNQINYLVLRRAKTISLNIENLGGNSYRVLLSVFDENGDEVQISGFTPEVEIKENVDTTHSYVYLNNQEVNCLIRDNRMVVNTQINASYDIIPTYAVNLVSSSSVDLQASQLEGNVGDEIHLSITPKTGYKINSILVKTRNGKLINLDANNNFIMPASDVTVSVVCVRLQYTLELYVDDALYASYYVNYGDTIVLPTYIKKVGTEEYEYLFTGWGIKTESISVTEDTKLYAEFVTVDREVEIEKKTSNAVKIAGYVAIGVIVAGIASGVLVLLLKVRKSHRVIQK